MAVAANGDRAEVLIDAIISITYYTFVFNMATLALARFMALIYKNTSNSCV